MGPCIDKLYIKNKFHIAFNWRVSFTLHVWRVTVLNLERLNVTLLNFFSLSNIMQRNIVKKYKNFPFLFVQSTF